MKPRALVRAVNLVLCFDTEKADTELEKEVLERIQKINKVLMDELPNSLPQIQLEDMKKKIKIGVKLYKKSDFIDE